MPARHPPQTPRSSASQGAHHQRHARWSEHCRNAHAVCIRSAPEDPEDMISTAVADRPPEERRICRKRALPDPDEGPHLAHHTVQIINGEIEVHTTPEEVNYRAFLHVVSDLIQSPPRTQDRLPVLREPVCNVVIVLFVQEGFVIPDERIPMHRKGVPELKERAVPRNAGELAEDMRELGGRDVFETVR